MRVFVAEAFALELVGFEFKMRLDLFRKILLAALAIEHVRLPRGWVRGGCQEPFPCACEAAPFAGLLHELLAAFLCQRVKARLAVVLADAPFGGDPFLVFEALQRKVERAVSTKKASSDWR